MDSRRTTKRMWRWRRNPLRRHADVVEAWTVLAVWAVVTVGGTFVGTLAARAADESFARHRAERHPVRAVLTADAPRTSATTGLPDGRVRAKVRWTAADGTVRTGSAPVESGLEAGSPVVVWADSREDLVSEPLDSTEAAVEAGALGTAAGLAFAGAAYGSGAAVRWRLERRRIEQWGTEWDLVGPMWGHRTG
jgi:hypothetical protein